MSALLTPHGPPDRIVRHALAGHVSLLHDERILAEYRSVLARPRFGFDQGDVRLVLAQLERRGERVLAPPLPITLPDTDDLAFLEVAAAGRADALVTGNARHFQPTAGSHHIPILSPADLLRQLVDRG